MNKFYHMTWYNLNIPTIFNPFFFHIERSISHDEGF